MAKIYSGIEGIEVPELNFNDFPKYQKACDDYIQAIQDNCKANCKQPNVGEVIKIPHADGYAIYVIAQTKPVALIHIDIMDGWHNEMAELLTAKKIDEMVTQNKKMVELFGEK